MSALNDHVARYLRARRALGVKLERAGRLLPQLVAYLEAAEASTITRELAISWAKLPAGAHPQYWASRLSIARGFAAYLQTIDPKAEIPPAGVFAVRYQRQTPYLWSQQDISRLLDSRARAASAVEGGQLRGAVRAARRDRHAPRRSARARARRRGSRGGVITIRRETAKLERARLVPLHPTTVRALERYARMRALLCPTPRSETFFLSSVGTRLDRSAVAKTLRTLTTTLGLRTDTVHPTAHQLRHSFAVSTLIDWQRRGVQIDEQIAVLSTYLGHVSPAESYWYLTATPELMDSAAQRLEQHLGGRP